MKTIDQLWQKLKNVELIQVRPSEMEAMYKHCFEFKNPLIVEIGSAHGASSTILAEATKELNGEMACIDSYPEDYYAQEKFGDYARKAFKKNMKDYLKDVIVVLFEDPSTEQNYKDFWGKFCPQAIDILFVDGDHSYEGVKKDCELYLHHLRPGGYVGFHDYNNVAFGVKQAADEFTQGWEKESVWDLAIFKKP